jgi:hypothetical protein
VLLNLIGCTAVSALSMRSPSRLPGPNAFWASIGYDSPVCEPECKELMSSCLNADASQKPSEEEECVCNP